MKDSRLSRALTWIIDLIFSGVLWTLFSLPVFTVGAASTGLYYAAVKCIRRERGRLWPVFWKGFRDNFRCATKLWLLFLAAMLVGAANVLAARQWSGQGISPLTALGGVIILPLSRTGIVTAATFEFLTCWNEFVFANLIVSSEKLRTIQVGIRYFTNQFSTDYVSMYAAIVISIVPSILGYIVFQEQIISGMTSGAVKG